MIKRSSDPVDDEIILGHDTVELAIFTCSSAGQLEKLQNLLVSSRLKSSSLVRWRETRGKSSSSKLPLQMLLSTRLRTLEATALRIQRFTRRASFLLSSSSSSSSSSLSNQNLSSHMSRGAHPRRSRRWSTNTLISRTRAVSSSSLPILSPVADFQRSRQRWASTHVCTASRAGRNDSMWWSTSSGSAPTRSSPPPPSRSIILRPLFAGGIPSNRRRARCTASACK
ncbi:Os11g0201966, partial [Oryza sativa Japonica Group]